MTNEIFDVGTIVYYKDKKEVVKARIIEAMFFGFEYIDFEGDYYLEPVNTECCYRSNCIKNEEDLSTDKKVILQRIFDEINEERRTLAELHDKVLFELIEQENKPKFEVGDEIRNKKTGLCFTITQRDNNYIPTYEFKNLDLGSVNNSQRFVDENFELVKKSTLSSEEKIK